MLILIGTIGGGMAYHEIRRRILAARKLLGDKRAHIASFKLCYRLRSVIIPNGYTAYLLIPSQNAGRSVRLSLGAPVVGNGEGVSSCIRPYAGQAVFLIEGPRLTVVRSLIEHRHIQRVTTICLCPPCGIPRGRRHYHI